MKNRKKQIIVKVSAQTYELIQEMKHNLEININNFLENKVNNFFSSANYQLEEMEDSYEKVMSLKDEYNIAFRDYPRAVIKLREKINQAKKEKKESDLQEARGCKLIYQVSNEIKKENERKFERDYMKCFNASNKKDISDNK